MLFALRQPATLLGLVVGFAACLAALSGATRLLNRASRYSMPFWHPHAWLDPYSAVAALLGGIGWPARPEVRRGFGHSQHRQLWLVAAVSFAVPAALGAAGIAGYVALAGRGGLPLMDSMSVLHGDSFAGLLAPTAAEKMALGFGVECLAVAVLTLVPIPPLPIGVALWTVLPRTEGARRLAYHLLEESWGVVALLVLTLLPLASEGPLLLILVTNVIDGILHST